MVTSEAPKQGWFARQKERAKAEAEKRGKRLGSLAGVTLYEHWIEQGLSDPGHPVAGATASVDTAGNIERRVSMTRLATLGVGAFMFKKKKDSRELYLLVEGEDFSFVKEIDPKDGKKAREFASLVNQAGKRATGASA